MGIQKQPRGDGYHGRKAGGKMWGGKIGNRGMFEMCSWDEVDYLVTESAGDSPILKGISSRKVNQLVA